MIGKTLEEGSHFFEWTHCTLDGKNIPCTVLLSKIEDGGRAYIHAVVRDISKQKDLERQLLQSNQYVDFALEGAGLGIWDWYLETNAVKFDKRWAEMLGLDIETIPMELATWESRVHPDDLQPCYADMQAYMNGETDVYENVHRMRHAQGHWVSILDRGRFSDWDDQGKPIRFTGTHFDITQSKEKEKERSLILEKNKIGIWKYNPVDQSLDWDESMYALYGMNKEDFSGAYDAWSSSLHPDYAEKAQKELQEAVDGIKPFDTTFAIQTPRGEIKYIQARAIIDLDPEGKAILVTGVNSDITREHLALQSAEKSESR